MRFSNGLPETPCGAGSTLETTTHLRGVLPGMLKRLGVRHLLDAPCGDCNWIVETDLSGLEVYTGLDLFHSDAAAERWRQKEAEAAKTLPALAEVIRADIRSDPLPECDAILSRDFFQHMPNADCVAILERFRKTGARWLIATQFANDRNEDISQPGQFRFFNMKAPPLSLGGAAEVHPDPPGSPRTLCAWTLNQQAAKEAAL